MGVLRDQTQDFTWIDTEVCHFIRRREMLANPKYSQKIKSLMGHDWTISLYLIPAVILQLSIAYILRNSAVETIFLVAFLIGGTLNQSLAISLHEIGHNLAFGYTNRWTNILLGFIANAPLGIPSAGSFKKYHLEHHKFQADQVLDVDLPTSLEARIFKGPLGKFLWLALQPFFFALRPGIVHPTKPNSHELANWIFQLTFTAVAIKFFGIKFIIYLLASTLLGLGIHPISGHFISEHYMFIKGYETYSYYGPLNSLTWNVGYHNEHHDFPNVPARYLPEIKRTAPEYYENIPSHNSWSKCLFDFVFDPEVTLWCRIKRQTKINSKAN